MIIDKNKPVTAQCGSCFFWEDDDHYIGPSCHADCENEEILTWPEDRYNLPSGCNSYISREDAERIVREHVKRV